MATTSHHRLARETLRSLRAAVEADAFAPDALWHPGQDYLPHWQEDGLQVVPNESFERTDDALPQIVIFTRHAAPLGWALLSVRDALAPYLSPENRPLIFGQLGLALRVAQAGPDGSSARGLLRALLDTSEDVLEAAVEAHRLHRRRRSR